MKKFLIIGILMIFGVFCYGNFAFAIVPTMDFDLGNADASFIGEARNNYSGMDVSGAGDVNNDGFDDFLIGAINNNEGGFGAGQTYLILGKAAGWVMDINLSNAVASFIGEAIMDGSGGKISEVGDVNNDGFDDFLIGANGNSEGGSLAGQTYLILGKAGGWAMDTSLSNVDASFIGEAISAWANMDVSGAGDVNNDGFDDFLIGASNNSEGGADAGQTYLILGKAGGWAMDTSLSNVDASFIGEAVDDWSGAYVSGAGDVNNDGFDDFLIGAYGNDEGGNATGQTYLIFGKAAGWAMDTSLSNADVSFIGEAAGDVSGQMVSEAGDVNNDGFDDFLIGAYGNDEGGNATGQTYLIFGKAAGWAMDTSLSNADVSFIGEAAGNMSGWSISSAGDVNNDGFDDFLIGVRYNDEGGANAGQTYLIFGKAAGWVMDINLSNAVASFIGEAAGDVSGRRISEAGDVNNDGFDDFLIGARGNDEGGFGAGQTYLILTEPPISVTIEAYDKNGVLIDDEETISASVVDPLTLTSVATASTGETIWFHNIDFNIDGDAYSVDCGSAGFCSVDICTVPGVDCSADFVAGATVTYSSYAIDTGINVGSDPCCEGTYSFTVTGIPTLSVVLSSNPLSGTAPLPGVDLIADVEGTALGNVDYTFDCDISAAGPTFPYIEPDDYTASGICDYLVAGNYIAKVEVTRQGVTASDTTLIPVGVANQAPTVTLYPPDQPTPAEYCGCHPEKVRLGWVFSDPEDGADQDSVEFKIIRLSDSELFTWTGTTQTIMTGQIIRHFYGDYFIRYNEEYSWQVEAWDSGGLSSGVIHGVNFSTPVHKYPDVDFSCSLDGGMNWNDCATINPKAYEVITFDSDQPTSSGCDGGISEAYGGANIDFYVWTFGDGNADAGPAASSSSNAYSAEGIYTVTLQIRDDTPAVDDGGFICPCSQTINISKAMPKWKEVVPR